MTREIDCPALFDFVAKRRKETGGYGATPKLPATIADTFQALAILTLIEPHSPDCREDRALAAFLEQRLASPWPGIDTSFRLFAAARLCGLALPEEGRVNAYLEQILGRDKSLAATSYAVRIRKEIYGTIPVFSDRSRELPEIWAVQEVFSWLYLRKMAGEDGAGAREQMVDWLKRSQNGDGGFGFFPGTTSFIENSHAALAALNLLGAKPLDRAGAEAFIVGCQTRRGGFARSPKAAPFLDSSWHGLASLSLLSATRPAALIGSDPALAMMP